MECGKIYAAAFFESVPKEGLTVLQAYHGHTVSGAPRLREYDLRPIPGLKIVTNEHIERIRQRVAEMVLTPDLMLAFMLGIREPEPYDQYDLEDAEQEERMCEDEHPEPSNSSSLDRRVWAELLLGDDWEMVSHFVLGMCSSILNAEYQSGDDPADPNGCLRDRSTEKQ
jgi:hypothetical protein